MHYRQLYYQSIDAAIATIEDHFKQVDYDKYVKLEQVLLLFAKKKDYSGDLETVLDFYSYDFNTSIDMSLRLSFRFSKKWRLDAQETH